MQRRVSLERLNNRRVPRDSKSAIDIGTFARSRPRLITDNGRHPDRRALIISSRPRRQIESSRKACVARVAKVREAKIYTCLTNFEVLLLLLKTFFFFY